MRLRIRWNSRRVLNKVNFIDTPACRDEITHKTFGEVIFRFFNPLWRLSWREEARPVSTSSAKKHQNLLFPNWLIYAKRKSRANLFFISTRTQIQPLSLDRGRDLLPDEGKKVWPNQRDSYKKLVFYFAFTFYFHFTAQAHKRYKTRRCLDGREGDFGSIARALQHSLKAYEKYIIYLSYKISYLSITSSFWPQNLRNELDRFCISEHKLKIGSKN